MGADARQPQLIPKPPRRMKQPRKDTLRVDGRFTKDWRADYRHTGPMPLRADEPKETT